MSVDATLFEVVGSDNILKFIAKIFLFIGAILLTVAVTVIVILVIIKKHKNVNSYRNV